MESALNWSMVVSIIGVLVVLTNIVVQVLKKLNRCCLILLLFSSASVQHVLYSYNLLVNRLFNIVEI